MRYLIDTNICIYIINKRPIDVIRRFKTYEVGEIGISAITVSELQYGVAKSGHSERNQQRLEEFLTPFELVPYDEKAASVYGTIRSQLERRGLTIGPLDMLIAAQAVSRDLVLVTNNTREFERVKKLRLENWAE
jgi:tRNA(fMet)-specific endonuclease VapC